MFLVTYPCHNTDVCLKIPSIKKGPCRVKVLYQSMLYFAIIPKQENCDPMNPKSWNASYMENWEYVAFKMSFADILGICFWIFRITWLILSPIIHKTEFDIQKLLNRTYKVYSYRWSNEKLAVAFFMSQAQVITRGTVVNIFWGNGLLSGGSSHCMDQGWLVIKGLCSICQRVITQKGPWYQFQFQWV